MALTGATLAGVSCLSLDRVFERDVHLAIKNLKTKTTMGPDLIPQYLIKELMSLFGFESLSLRRDVMEQMFLRCLVQGRVDSAEGLGVISFRVPSFNSRGRLLFELPHVRTVAHASSLLLRMRGRYKRKKSKFYVERTKKKRYLSRETAYLYLIQSTEFNHRLAIKASCEIYSALSTNSLS
ncbi:hypothetical protein J6590_058918 [Homalodisca vitripennis]|nr:hypothetical protein J6590_058918 [Homalodisca vitripennis]